MSALWPVTLPAPLVTLRSQAASLSFRTEMETGRMRQRRTALEPSVRYDAQWNFTEDQFEEFKEFFDVTLENGSLSFLIDMGEWEAELAFLAPYNFNRTDNLFAVGGVLEEIEAAASVPSSAMLFEDGESMLEEDEDFMLIEG